MLVDLGRNDLGRVCDPGTVEVVEFMEVRRYSHIMHLESTVTGTVPRTAPRSMWYWRPFRPGRCPVRPKFGRWRSSTSWRFPDEGLYGGVVGYLDFAGDGDAAIAIRTAMLRDGVAYVCGPVAESSPTRTLHGGSGNPEQGCCGDSGHLRCLAVHRSSRRPRMQSADRGRMRSRTLALGCLLIEWCVGADRAALQAVVARQQPKASSYVRRDPSHGWTG